MIGVAPAGAARSRSGVGERDRAGQILAARWSIERLHRPSGPDLVWLGYAKPEIASFECLACGTAGMKQGVLRAEGRTLYLCGSCASHQFHPTTQGIQAEPGFMRRYRIEYVADPLQAAALVARAVAGHFGGRLLDLGCGLGLAVDMAARLPGWSAAGLDPGPLPSAGAGPLGVRLETGGAATVAELAADLGGEVTVLLCDRVLDRSPDPLGLLRAAQAEAAPDARWLLATDDAETLYSATEAATIRRLAAPDRILIPSRIGLMRLLELAGWTDLEVIQSDGLLRADRAVAGPSPPPGAVLDPYLASRPATLPQDSVLRMTLLARALERAVVRRDWAAGRSLASRLASPLAAASEAAREAADHDSLAALLRNAPVCSPSLLYQLGMLHLHGSEPSTQALLCFELCAALAGRAYALAPLLMQAEAERHWAARFQCGEALSHMGEAEAARGVFAAVAASTQAGAAGWAERARAELERAAAAAVEPEPAAPSPRKPRRSSRSPQ